MRLSVNMMVEPQSAHAASWWWQMLFFALEPQSATCAAMPQTVLVPTLISYCNHDSVVLCSYDIVFIACDIVLCALLVPEAAQPVLRERLCEGCARYVWEKRSTCACVHVCFATVLSEARYIAYLSEARYIADLFERDALHGVSDNRWKSAAHSRKKTHIIAYRTRPNYDSCLVNVGSKILYGIRSQQHPSNIH